MDALPADPDPEPSPELTVDLAVPLPAGGQLSVDISVLCEAATAIDWSAAMHDALSALLGDEDASGALPAAADLELSLRVSTDEDVRALNRTWRGQDKPTNILSFAALDEDDAPPHWPGAPLVLGDLVIAWPTLAREAAALDQPTAAYARHLLIHGLLHLLGHDHQSDAEAEAMEALEARLLARLGLPDPYAAGPAPAAASPDPSSTPELP